MSSSPASDVASNDGSASRNSLDRERILGSPPPLNGIKTDRDASQTHQNGDAEDLDPAQRLEQELQRTREEKDALATQYRNLLAKLTTMRTTLGNKLQQDAVRTSLHSPSPVFGVDARPHQRMHRKNSTVRSSLCSS